MADNKVITSWIPVFDDTGNFKEIYGWDVVLKHIFLTLVTPKGSRQWNPEFGSRLLSFLFESTLTEQDFNDEIQNVFNQQLPHIHLVSVTTQFTDFQNRTGKRANVSMKIRYDGEDKQVTFDLPDGLDLMSGSIYDVNVIRTEKIS